MLTRTFLLFSALAVAAGSQAAIWQIDEILEPGQEVHSVTSDATGTVSGTYDDVTNMLSLTVTASNFTSNVTMAHVHGPAPRGQNAGILFHFMGATGSQSYSDTRSWTLSDTQEASLFAGLTYVNIHTANFGAGEVRGQLEPVPEPATLIVLGAGALALLRRRR